MKTLYCVLANHDDLAITSVVRVTGSDEFSLHEDGDIYYHNGVIRLYASEARTMIEIREALEFWKLRLLASPNTWATGGIFYDVAQATRHMAKHAG